jgi:hypothetical protein
MESKDEFVRRKLQVTSREPRPIPNKCEIDAWFLRLKARMGNTNDELERWYRSNHDEA